MTASIRLWRQNKDNYVTSGIIRAVNIRITVLIHKPNSRFQTLMNLPKSGTVQHFSTKYIMLQNQYLALRNFTSEKINLYYQLQKIQNDYCDTTQYPVA